MIWGLFALLAGITYCVQAQANKHYQIDGFTLNKFRSLFASVLMVLAIPFMEWPSSIWYYFVVFMVAALSVIFMLVQYNLSAKKNGRIACMHQSISVVLTFSFWLAIDESQRNFLLDNPFKVLLILLAFFVFIFSVQFIRKNDTGWSAFLIVFPISILYSVITVLTKLVLDGGESLLPISLNFVFLSNLFMFLISLPFYLLKNKHEPIQRKLLTGAGVIAIFHTLSWVLACIAIILTPNPAYVSVIIGLAPIWFMLYYRFRCIKDNASPIAGLFMALAAIIVLLSSS